MTALTRRILLRLDPARPQDGALAHAMRLAKALHAELAARMISDTRLAFAGLDVERELRRAESSLRRELKGLGARESANWSFEVVHCAGILARECAMEADDIVAIELPRIEFSMAELREEIAATLACARGVVLFPATDQAARGPVVAVVADRKQSKALIDQADGIAEALKAPLHIVEHDGEPPTRLERHDAGDIATSIRKLGAVLAIVDPADPIASALLARPRLLRELGAPLLLLKSA